MDLFIPTDWEHINLLTEKDPNKFGEALRGHCFVGTKECRGCYDTFEMNKCLTKITEGPIYEEAKRVLCPEFEECITVYHFKVEEKDCYIEYNDGGRDIRHRVCDPFEIVCAWLWDGDGHLYFRFNDRCVENTDCKKDYVWEWC